MDTCGFDPHSFRHESKLFADGKCRTMYTQTFVPITPSYPLLPFSASLVVMVKRWICNPDLLVQIRHEAP